MKNEINTLIGTIVGFMVVTIIILCLTAFSKSTKETSPCSNKKVDVMTYESHEYLVIYDCGQQVGVVHSASCLHCLKDKASKY